MHATQAPPSPTVGGAISPPVAEVVSVDKEFGNRPVLHDISIAIPSGAIVGLIGPSGCGKTTLVQILTGMITPTAGQVRVFGNDPTTFTVEQRTRLGYMPQLPVLFPNLTVWENLNFAASMYGVAIRGRRRRLRRLLDLVDLSEHRAKKMSECSGGMQRRLALAATLVHEPQLLFLDEPTAGVDPILRERFWEHFRALRDEGRTVVVPTQYVGEAVSCDVVAVMAEGRLLTVLPPEQLAGFAYGGHPILVELDGWLPRHVLQRLRESDHVRSVQVTDAGMKVVVHGDLDDPATHLRQWLAAAGASVGEITSFEPSFDDIFVEIIERHAGDGGGSTP